MSNDTVLFDTKECDRCDGIGRYQGSMIRHHSTIRNDDDLVALGKEDISCSSCNGFGYLSKNHTAYKSEAMANRHKAKVCYMCNTHGVVQEHTVWYDCPSCRGQGVEEMQRISANTTSKM
jgi:DnaJ-class molecular chaperone